MAIQSELSGGDLRLAADSLADLSRAFPTDPRIFNFQGVVLAQLGDYTGSEGAFLRAIQLAPTFTGALLNLGRLYQENVGKDSAAIDKAIPVYRQAIQAAPGEVEPVYQLSRLLYGKGDYPESLELLEKLPDDTRSVKEAWILECGNLMALGRQPASDLCVDRIVGASDVSEADLDVVFPGLRGAGRIEELTNLLQGLERRGRLSIPGTESLAFLLDGEGKYQQATELLGTLAGRHPDLPALLVEMAWLSYRNHDFEVALSYLAHARDLKPEDPRIHLFFGMTCVELNLSVDALKSMEQAVALDPDNPFSNYVMGATVMKWREPGEAIPYLKRYTDARPDDPKGQATLGEAYFLNKEYQRARTVLAPLVTKPDTKIMAHFYLGVIDRLEQDFDSSMAHLQTVIELQPDHADALAELGALYTRMRDYENATRVLNRALELDPEHYQANFNLLTLYSRTRDDRYAAQKDRFEKIKEERWQSLTDSLRTVEVIPHQVFPELQFPGYSRPGGSQ